MSAFLSASASPPSRWPSRSQCNDCTALLLGTDLVESRPILRRSLMDNHYCSSCDFWRSFFGLEHEQDRQQSQSIRNQNMLGWDRFYHIWKAIFGTTESEKNKQQNESERNDIPPSHYISHTLRSKTVPPLLQTVPAPWISDDLGWIIVSRPHSGGLVHVLRCLKSDGEVKDIGFEIYRHPNSQCKWPGLLPACPLPPSYMAPKRIQRLQSWLTNCRERHRCLEDNMAPILPTRVIDLSLVSDSVFSVLETNSERGRYICLSYCWGDGNPLKLKTSNLSSLQSGRELAELPALFRDVVSLATNLSIKYVWIDALCIIQDSESDWEREAGQMGQVYGNAYVTIAASVAKNCHSKLFTDARERDPQVSESLIQVRLARHPAGFPDTRTREQVPPLEGRGWAFQEYILSPRVLHFTDDEMVWHCNEELACECRAQSSMVARPKSTGPPPKDTHPMSLGVSLRTIFNNRGNHQPDYAWRVCVEQFSQRIFTKQSDVLPALSGVAHTFKDEKGSKYLAGTWNSSRLEDLCWRRRPNSQNDAKDTSLEEQTEYICPSWSWPAARGPVEFNWNTKTSFFRPPLQMKILEISTTSSLHDSYGKVSNGFLIVESWAFQVNFVINSDWSIKMKREQSNLVSSVISSHLGGEYYCDPYSTIDYHRLLDRNLKEFKAWAIIIQSWEIWGFEGDRAVCMLLRCKPSQELETPLWERIGTLWDICFNRDIMLEKFSLQRFKIV